MPLAPIKGQIGNLAAGCGVDAAAAVLGLHHGKIPPAVNTRKVIDGMKLNVRAGSAGRKSRRRRQQRLQPRRAERGAGVQSRDLKGKNMFSAILEFWYELPRILRVCFSLGLIALSVIVFFAGRIWPLPAIVGLILLLFLEPAGIEWVQFLTRSEEPRP